MSHCSTSLLLLTAITFATVGCSANTFTTLQPSEGLRPSLMLLPSAPKDGEEIGSLTQETTAQAVNLGRYRHRFSQDSLRHTTISRHPFR